MEARRLRDKLIIGGTGTLGKALLAKLPTRECIVFSRDELKQHELRHEYPDLRCVLGDIRSKDSLKTAMDGIKTVYHVAALKHVDVLESNPEEAYKTNILGTMNSADLATQFGVQDFYFTSTDKAVLPINVYGMTKAISERYLLNLNRQKPFSTRFRVFRWGNIIGSRGSVVNLFTKSLVEEGKVRVTDKRMTRFWLRIDDAIEYMNRGYLDHSKVNFPEMKGAKVVDLAKAIAVIIGLKKYDIEEIGIRPGEKLHECIYSSHDECVRSDNSKQFTLQELVDQITPYVRVL